MVNMQMFHIIKNWTKFECDPPPDDDVLFELLFTSSNRSLIIPNTISDDYKKNSEVNLVGLVFFVENFPDLVKEHLFQRYFRSVSHRLLTVPTGTKSRTGTKSLVFCFMIITKSYMMQRND
jgi:hypothetical protein